MKEKRRPVTRMLALLSVFFLVISAAGLYLGSHYISDQLLHSGEATATDLALLVKNNFEITDAEVAYMKSLTFNEMEVDPINRRLMNVGNGVRLNAAVNNVYLLAPLSKEEYRYCPDEKSAAFLGVATDTPLDGMWLLNGKINEKGVFEAAQREDIYRYTVLNDNDLWGMKHREPFGTFTNDAWGSFITGYAPVYTVEGNFVGLIGIDMDPDSYQSSAERMVFLIVGLFAFMIFIFFAMSMVFFLKYEKVKDAERKFIFFSDMSHEMRTPLNGILGMASLSKQETDITVLHQNFAKVESSGKYLLKLINHTLDYKNSKVVLPLNEAVETPAHRHGDWPELCGKRLLLCEDHPINAEITRKMVEHIGCKIDLAENGRCGLEKLKSSSPHYYDAILMDIRMPVMDGIEAAKRIRSLEREDAAAIPIIAVTANSYEEDMKKTKAAGMNAHLTKPVEPLALYQKLSELICPEIHETERRDGNEEKNRFDR